MTGAAWPVAVLVLAALLALVLTRRVERRAHALGLLDMPNARSAHELPTPRGGGIAVVAAFFFATVVLAAAGRVPPALLGALAGAGLVALVGWLDDRRSVPARWRLLVHVVAACWALVWLEGFAPVELFGRVLDLGWPGLVLAVLYLVWLLNLYNFMDGIDGLAGVEALTVGLGASLLYLLPFPAARPDAALLPAVLAAAALGFLRWNFPPPARIFLGDVGSGFIGFAFGVLSLHAAGAAPRWLWVWLVLLAVFVVDATVTLLVRLVRGERLSEAHCGHGYQIAARRWGHRRVTVAVALINLLGLAPLAALIAAGVLDGAIGFAIACVPLGGLVGWLRAGELSRGKV